MRMRLLDYYTILATTFVWRRFCRGGGGYQKRKSYTNPLHVAVHTYLGSGNASDILTPFIDARQNAGRPN